MKESSITYHSKAMANVQVVADKQTGGRKKRQTKGLAKNYMPPLYRCGGIKNQFCNIVQCNVDLRNDLNGYAATSLQKYSGFWSRFFFSISNVSSFDLEFASQLYSMFIIVFLLLLTVSSQ